ncbi:MAG: hypothetical protein RSG92_25030 [Pseudomonas sp.]
MELIYTTQRDGFEQGRTYRNPRHFEQVEPGVESIVVIGDWPKVAAAYEEAGAEVSVVEVPKIAPQKVVLVGGLSSGVSELLVAELASIGVIVESFAAQSLERPEGELGETASRLFEVLEAVNAGVLSLQRERDGTVEQVAKLEQEKLTLLNQLEELKIVNGDPEIEAMKAKLDAAGVTYRANASKEALLKLIDELPKA